MSLREESPTASERYLASLCRLSFLRFWSWPNVYRDQRWSGAEGKEICDLLVVFDDHVLIFSDKYCAFPDTGDLGVDWSRWYKKAILKSAKQIWGAERWLTQHPDRVFLDKACTERFPFSLPSPEKMRVYRIVVAHGAGQRCRQELGGSGSLMIRSDVIGDDHTDPKADRFTPFTVGRIDAQRGFVHVVDDVTLDVVLQNVDTGPDFIEYLNCKEELLSPGKRFHAAGEEELLGYYLRHANPDGDHDFGPISHAPTAIITEGIWDAYSAHPDRLAQLEADKISYFWDTLIERFTQHLFEGTQEFTSGDSVSDVEIPLRLMARESRTERRALAKCLYEVAKRADNENRSARVVASPQVHKPIYVFLAYRRPPEKSNEEYRTSRRKVLRAYCLVARLKQKKGARNVLGLAVEPTTAEGTSEDLMYLDGGSWCEELEEEARQLQELGLLKERRTSALSEYKYPRVHNERMRKGRNRNQPCSCGSGKKYKKCCGQQATPNAGIPIAPAVSEI